ncbi:hypothetical protein [Nocardia seriolae]|uniref:Uncharacterized protein n=2 Tax=Nocardia seriolae TaxID=37332 RepID=A0A0B8NCU6_9NOCA|nr:hypothetical protein [Nocardia seriolae]MTJ60222.1 prevent-host-death protein [Nocardia seriolae]MTJ72608.1 prevent-host-death protein [Nocardia seriolae]MTJ85217.1 prevent-host-death protein [Nocardia seriolae]MTK29213.1 prevent-host-death protein [Nocardia seriolae]MTK38153.1 prevent-host-death protein [Nocardia seriolae]
MAVPEMSPPTEVSVRQFVNDSGAVTRGLREGRKYLLTINGEPLAEVTPIRRHRFVRTSQAQTMFATAPTLDYEELRRDLDTAVTDELSEDPFEGTGL